MLYEIYSQKRNNVVFCTRTFYTFCFYEIKTHQLLSLITFITMNFQG